MATWQEGTCNEQSGFLFKHECFQLPTFTCQTCGKPICEDHTHELPDGTFCTSCARGHIKQPSGPSQPPAQGDTSTRSGAYDHHYYNNDPFLYSSSYYYGYHWGSHSSRSSSSHHNSSSASSGMSVDASANDPLNFTEADGGSFETEQDEDLGGGDFENDMSES